MTPFFDISQIQEYHYDVTVYKNGYMWSAQAWRPVAGRRFGGGLLGIPGSGAVVFYTAVQGCFADSDMPRGGGKFRQPKGYVDPGGDDNWRTQNIGGTICLLKH